MSILTLYCNNPEQSGSSAGLLALTQPTASTSTTGWTVASLGTERYARQIFRTERAANQFGSTPHPQTGPFSLANDCYRISATTSGDFSAGTWYSSLSMIAESSGGTTPTATLLHSGISLGNASTYTTPGTILVSANALALISITHQGTTLQSVTSVRGGGLSNWVSVASTPHSTTARVSVWRGMTATPGSSSRVTVILSGTVSNCQLVITQFLGVDITGADGANAIVSSTTTTGTTSHLTALMPSVSSADNIIYGAFSWASRNAGHTQATGFTELADVGSTEAQQCSNHVMWSSSSQTRPSSKPVASLTGGGVALELKTVFPAGRARFRLWRAASADGASATELTQGTMVGSALTGLSTTVAQSSSASTNIGAFSLANEYLFQQVAWETLTPGLQASDDRLIRFGSMESITGSGLVTTNFTPTGGAGAALFAGYYNGYYYPQIVQDV